MGKIYNDIGAFVNQALPFDVVVWHTNTFFGALVRRFVRSPWSHVSLVLPHRVVLDAVFPKVKMVENVAESYANVARRGVILRPNVTVLAKHHGELAAYAREMNGTAYDITRVLSLGVMLLFGRWALYGKWWSAIDKKANLMCVETVLVAYERILGFSPGVIENAVPDSLLESKDFTYVALYDSKA